MTSSCWDAVSVCHNCRIEHHSLERAQGGLKLGSTHQHHVGVSWRRLEPLSLLEQQCRVRVEQREAVAPGVKHALHDTEPVSCLLAPHLLHLPLSHCETAAGRWECLGDADMRVSAARTADYDC